MKWNSRVRTDNQNTVYKLYIQYRCIQNEIIFIDQDPESEERFNEGLTNTVCNFEDFTFLV